MYDLLSHSGQELSNKQIQSFKTKELRRWHTIKAGWFCQSLTGPLLTMEEDDWDAEPYGDDWTTPFEPFEANIVNATGKPVMMHSLTNALINA